MTKNRFYRAIFYNHEKLVNTGIVTCDSNFSAMYWYYSLGASRKEETRAVQA